MNLRIVGPSCVTEFCVTVRAHVSIFGFIPCYTNPRRFVSRCMIEMWWLVNNSWPSWITLGQLTGECKRDDIASDRYWGVMEDSWEKIYPTMKRVFRSRRIDQVQGCATFLPFKPVLIRLIDFLDLWEDGRESWKGLKRINASFR